MKIFDGWLFWALGAAFVWGLGQVLAKRSLVRLSPLAYNLLSVPIDFALLLPFALLFGIHLRTVGWLDLALMILITSTYIFYYYMLSLEKVSLVGTVLSAYSVFTVVLSLLFLGERFSPWQFVWVFMIMLGLFLTGLRKEVGRIKLEKWFWLALFTAMAIGSADFFSKVVIGRVGVGTYLFLYPFCFFPSLLVSFLFDRDGRRLPHLSFANWLSSLAGAALIALGVGFFFVAFAKGPASLVAPVSGSYQALTIILALVFLKEKLSRFQALGVGLTLLGVVFVGQ